MNIAILDAVPEKYWHVDDNVTDADKFVSWLRLASPDCEPAVYYVAEDQWPDLNHHDAYLITGSPCSVHDPYPWVEDLECFVRDSFARQKTLVGVCFGHQLIAKALGGQVERATGWLIGLHRFEVSAAEQWMRPVREQSSIYFFNQDQVRALPPGARLLARSEQCPHAAYAIGDRLLSLQGHPEQPLRAMHNFIQHMRNDTNGELLDQALVTLKGGEPDDRLWADWVCGFIKTSSTV